MIYRYWSKYITHWITKGNTKHHQKINVWASLINDTISVVNFFKENVTRERYLQFLRTEVLPVPASIFLNANNPNLSDDSIWLEQDGATLHYARDVGLFLNPYFPGKWSPRSPDLTPQYFLLWDYLKSKFYAENRKIYWSCKTELGTN